MKQLTLISTLFLLSISVLTAQPVLTQSDIGFAIGDSHLIDSLTFMDMSDLEGPNMTWDLSSLTTLGTPITSVVLDPSTLSSSAGFPTSTLARRIVIPELILDQFFNYDAESMQHQGTYLAFGGDDITSFYTNPEIAMPIPMSYGDSGSDTYASEISGGPVAAETSGEIMWSVPGYGTLIVNGQTYNNVLMYKFIRDDVSISSFGGFTFETFSYEVTYLFMVAGYHYPIVVMTEDTTSDEFTPPVTTTEGSVMISQITGLDDVSDILPDLNVFPNPVSTDQLTIAYTLDVPMAIELNLVDLSGRLVFKRTFVKQSGQVRQLIQLPNEIEAGLYLMRFISEDGSKTMPLEIH